MINYVLINRMHDTFTITGGDIVITPCEWIHGDMFAENIKTFSSYADAFTFLHEFFKGSFTDKYYVRFLNNWVAATYDTYAKHTYTDGAFWVAPTIKNGHLIFDCD